MFWLVNNYLFTLQQQVVTYFCMRGCFKPPHWA